MKTLADFKRRLVPGLSVTVEFPGSVIRGNLGNTVIPGRTVARRVHAITPGGVYWESEKTPGAKGSFLDWPKASCLSFNGEAVAVSFEPGGEPFATYHFGA